jgi:argininosuccinate synthase
MIATMEADPTPHCGTYNQGDATGFIRLNALRLKVAAKVQRKK